MIYLDTSFVGPAFVQEPKSAAEEPKPDDKEQKKEGEGAEKKKDEAGDSVKRPEKPPRVPDPRERLRALFQMVAHEYQSHVIYSALLKALDHPAVQPVIDRVSKRRLDYLTASFRQTGLGREDALHRARLTYSAYVGFLQLNLQLHQARMPQEEFEAYVEHLAKQGRLGAGDVERIPVRR